MDSITFQGSIADQDVPGLRQEHTMAGYEFTFVANHDGCYIEQVGFCAVCWVAPLGRGGKCLVCSGDMRRIDTTESNATAAIVARPERDEGRQTMTVPVVVVWEDAGELGPGFYPADEPGVYPPIEPEEIARRLNAAEAKLAAAREERDEWKAKAEAAIATNLRYGRLWDAETERADKAEAKLAVVEAKLAEWESAGWVSAHEHKTVLAERRSAGVMLALARQQWDAVRPYVETFGGATMCRGMDRALAPDTPAPEATRCDIEAAVNQALADDFMEARIATDTPAPRYYVDFDERTGLSPALTADTFQVLLGCYRLVHEAVVVRAMNLAAIRNPDDRPDRLPALDLAKWYREAGELFGTELEDE